MLSENIAIGIHLFLTVVSANPGAGYVTLDQVEELLSRVTAPLLDRIDRLELKVAGLEKQEEERQGQIRQQEEKMEQLQIEIESLETEQKLQVQERSLETELNLQVQGKSLENDTNDKSNAAPTETLTGPSDEVEGGEKARNGKDETLKENGTYIRGQPSEVESGHRNRRQAVEHQVAFDVTMANPRTPLSRNQDIAFDTVLTNVGGAYNANHGVFLAPVNGIYVFSASVMAVPDLLRCSITVNGKDKVRMTGDDAHAFAQGSQSLVIQLNQGDDVSVRATFNDNTILSGDLYSSFSGFLLSEIYTKF